MTVTGESNAPLLDTVTAMTQASLGNAQLPWREVVLVRLACLVAVGAPRTSYAYNQSGPAASQLSQEDVEAVLVAAAPLVGTARIAAAADRIAEALGYPISVFDQVVRAEG